jgi:prephenate dehydratase
LQRSDVATFIAVVDGLGSDGIEWGLVPRENSIFGAVTETHDLLLSRSVGERLFIRAEATLRVQQCLLAQRGTDLARVRRVLSHEQVLPPPRARPPIFG